MTSQRKTSSKSYRTADTQMRAQIDEMQAAVVDKVDEVMETFRQDRLRNQAEAEAKARAERESANQNLNWGETQAASLGVRAVAVDVPQRRKTSLWWVAAVFGLVALGGGAGLAWRHVQRAETVSTPVVEASHPQTVPVTQQAETPTVLADTASAIATVTPEVKVAPKQEASVPAVVARDVAEVVPAVTASPTQAATPAVVKGEQKAIAAKKTKPATGKSRRYSEDLTGMLQK